MLLKGNKILSSLLLTIVTTGFLTACTSTYKTLQPTSGNAWQCVQPFQPQFTRTLYKAQIDVVGNHLSGLLLIKKMPDSSTRLLFTTETGVKFFDFEMATDGAFKVYYIMPKMNKKAVIKTLRKDFSLVLMNKLATLPQATLTRNGFQYNRFIDGKDYSYYVTDTACQQLLHIEKSSKRKLYATVVLKNYHQQVPDSIGISHHNFNFDISLQKIGNIAGTETTE